MMHAFYHASLEKILNTALRCLPEGSMPVGTDATDFLDGKVVALDTTDWPLGFQLRLSSKPVWSFVVDPADTVVPDAVLRGRLIDLFSAGLQGGDVRPLARASGAFCWGCRRGAGHAVGFKTIGCGY